MAIERANKLFRHWFLPEEAVAAVLVSYYNLGDLYLREGKVNTGERYYRQAHQIMEAALGQEEEGTARQMALLNGFRCSYTKLMMLTKRSKCEDKAVPSKNVII